MQNHSIFIVVLNWNNYEDTAECLSSLQRLTYENYQIVLVDNASTDGSIEKLQNEFPDVHVIINKENLGFAAGCNVGIKYSLEKGADAVLLINNDAVLEPEALEPAVKALFSREDIGIVGGKIKQYYNPSYIETIGVKHIIWPLLVTRSVGAGEEDKGQFDMKDKRKCVSGALMLVKRRVFETIGLLPEEYFFSCEDIDFCLQAGKKGFQIMYEPNFVAYHKGGRSSGKSPKYIYNFFLHRQVLIRRNVNSLLWGISRALLFIYARYYWYKRYIKREKLDANLQKEIKEAIQLAFKEGRFIRCINQNPFEKGKEIKLKLSLARVGDQVLLKDDKGNWFTPGYYQLSEIADMFGNRLGSFTAFGRIMQIEGDISHLYRIPVEAVPQFAVVGSQVRRKGIRAYLRVLPELVWKLRKVTATHDVSWLMMPSLAGLVGSLLAPRRTLKVVQLVGEWSMPLRLRYPKLAPLLVPLAEWLTRLSLRRADLAVFVSNYLKEKYGQRLKCQVMVANESRLRPWMIHKMDRREVHKPLRVLYVGRLVPEKGVQFLLEAIAFISKGMPCELWIAGSGPFEEKLKAKANELGIAKFIQWKGWVPWGEKLFEVMREADVLVMPTLPDIEGIGMVHFEAMSQSLPVIASRVDGIPEIVKDGISGILVEPGNSLAIAQAIQKVATDAELRQKLVAEGLQVAKENTVELQIGQVVEKICQLARRKGGKLG